MDLDALRPFVHLAESLHFGRTSRACGLSPSGLSRLVRRLEDEVSRPLFERDRRTVRLTPEGHRFAAHAREMLEGWRDFKAKVDAAPARVTGTIGLFASVTACQSFLPRVLASFREAYPDIHIRLETGYAADALERVAEGAVDVSVAALPDRVPPGFVARALLLTPLVLVAPASPCEVTALLARRPVPWSDVHVVLPAAGLARAAADRWFRRKRIAPRVYGEVPGNEAILSLVALGCGVGVVPRLVADRSPLRGEVNLVPVDPPFGELRVGLATRARHLRSPIVRAFWDSVRV